jgi:hypothetical protein
MPILPFKLNQDRRHHIPKQKRKVMNWREYDASLRQRGSLTVWFSDEAIEGWRAAPRTTPGGQPWSHSSPHFALASFGMNTPAFDTASAKFCISGASLCSGMLGMRS